MHFDLSGRLPARLATAAYVCASCAGTLLTAPLLLHGVGPTAAELAAGGLLAVAAAGVGAVGLRTRRPRDTPTSGAAGPDSSSLPRASVSALAHEVRTPLTAAVGHLDLVSGDPALGVGHRRRVESALGSVERASSLLADFLADPEAWRAGGVLPDPRPVDLDDLVRGALADFGPLAARRHVSIAYDSVGPLLVTGDGRALRQVVDNLLSNAVKYNEPHGWVDVRLTHDDRARVDRDGGAWAALELTNPGTTVADEETSRVFDPDFRGLGAADLAEGHGVGLSVVRRIVDAHAGEVALVSSPGTGTTSARLLLPACAS